MAVHIQDSDDKLIHGIGKTAKSLLTLVTEAEDTFIAVELAASLGLKNCIFKKNSLLVYPPPPNYVKFNSNATCDSF